MSIRIRQSLHSSKNKKSTIQNIFNLLFFIPFLVIPLFFAFSFFMPIWQGYQSLSWVETEGKLISSNADHPEKFEDLIFAEKTIPIKISYRYQVNQQTYTGERYAFFSINNSTEAEKFKTYTSGKKIPVFYNPQNPEKAVLVTGFRSKMVGGIFIILFLLIWFGLIGFTIWDSIKDLLCSLYPQQTDEYSKSLKDDKDTKAPQTLDEDYSRSLDETHSLDTPSAKSEMPHKKASNPYIYFRFAVIFTGIGLVILCGMGRKLYHNQQTESWIETQGTVLKSCVISRTRSGGRGNFSKTSYYTKLSILYQVDQQTYQPETTIHQNSANTAYTMVKTTYAPKQKITLFYNPEAPHKFTLIKGLHFKFSDIFIILFGILFFSVGILSFFTQRK